MVIYQLSSFYPPGSSAQPQRLHADSAVENGSHGITSGSM